MLLVVKDVCRGGGLDAGRGWTCPSETTTRGASGGHCATLGPQGRVVWCELLLPGGEGTYFAGIET